MFYTFFAHFSQVYIVPWYKGRLPFFVEGKITVSCSFLLFVFLHESYKNFHYFERHRYMHTTESCDSEYVICSKGLSKFRMLIGFFKSYF